MYNATDEISLIILCDILLVNLVTVCFQYSKFSALASLMFDKRTLDRSY